MKKVQTTMLLKIKTILFIFLLFFLVDLSAQEKPLLLNGIVKHDETNIENINVINKTSNIGTSSKKNGEFTISAIEGDSIMFSSIEYQNRIITITENHIKNKSLTVYLEPGFNELDEVEIIQKMRLEFENISIDNRTILDDDEITSYEAPNIDKQLHQGYMTNGMSLIGIYNLLTKNSRARKRNENDKKNEIANFKAELPNTLKKLYGVDFFTDWLYIPPNEVDLFLDYCQANGLSEYYNSNEFVIKNFLVIQSNEYNKINK